VQRLVGVSIRARLVDVKTGLVAQTGKIVAANMDEAIGQIPDLARQLMLTDEAKMQMEQDAQQKAAVPVAKAPDNEAIPPAPMPMAAEAPAPAAMVNPAPPVFADAKVVFFKNLAPPPDAVAAPPVDPLQGALRNRLLNAAIEKGDVLFQAGRFAEAQRNFQFAALLAPDNADIQARLQQVLPYVPPTPYGYVPKPRIAVMPFMTVGDPFVVPPYLGYWTPQNLAPYFAWRFDVADPGDIYWYMGRMGLSMNDVLVDPVARRWLGRAAGVRFFVFGNLVQTSSFDANTFMVDAESGYLQGQARINVNDTYELKLRLPELAQLTMMTPEEQAAYQMARLQQLIYAGQVHMAQGFFRQAADEFQRALAIDPYNVQAQVLLQAALTQASFQDFVTGQQQMYLAQQATWAALQQNQLALVQAAQLARAQAIAAAAARSDAENQRRAQIRIAAQANLANQAQIALKAGNFRLSLNLYQGAANVAPAQRINAQALAQARLGAQQAEQARVAQFTAVREKTLLKVRDQQLAQTQQAVAKEQAQSQKNLAAFHTAQAKRDEQAYQAGIAQGQQYLKQSKFASALTAFQNAQRLKQTEQVSTLIDGVVQQQATALAKTADEKAAVAQRLQAERERRKTAEAQAQQNDENYKLALSAAQTALAAKNYDAAKAKFQEAGKIFKTDAVLTGLKQIESAQTAQTNPGKEKTIPVDPLAANKLKLKEFIATGQAALKLKDYDAAEKALRSAGQIDPTDPGVVKGLKDVQAGRQAQRLADYQTALTTGQKALTGKDYSTAIKSFQQALQAMPDDAAAAKLLQQAQAGADKTAAGFQTAMDTGRKAMTAKSYPAAVKAFTEATKLDPTDATARTMLVQAQQALQDANAALKTATYQKAMTSGQAALTNKKYADAVKAFNDALKVMPADPTATQQLAQARQLLADSSKIKTPPEQPKQDFDGAMKRAAAAETDLNYSEALKAYREALKIRPKDFTAGGKAQFAQYIVNGQQYIDNMMWMDAVRELEGALRLQPKNTFALKLYQKAKNKGK
jgi:tetratricopeptide (TPR) repeat protein